MAEFQAMAWGNIGRWLTCDSAHSSIDGREHPEHGGNGSLGFRKSHEFHAGSDKTRPYQRGISDFALDPDADPVTHRGKLDRDVATDQLEVRRVDVTQRDPEPER